MTAPRRTARETAATEPAATPEPKEELVPGPELEPAAAAPAPAEEPAAPVEDDGLIRVRTSMKPDQDLRVTPAEHLDLEAQGLLVESDKEGARLRPSAGKE